MTTANDPYVMLHKVMTDAFTEEDLQSMCFELGEDPENIGGDTKVLRCWKMIYFFRQRERLPDLMGRVEANRPNLSDELAAVRMAMQQMTPAQAANTAIPAAASSEPAFAPAQPAQPAQPPASVPRDIVRKYAKSLTTAGVYFLGAIPKGHLENAYAAYAGDAKANSETPLLMMDVSLVSNGGAGLLLTDAAIYYKPSITNDRHQVKLADVVSVGSKKDFFGKLLVVNGNIEVIASSLSDEQMETMRLMLAECAGIKE